MVSLVLGYCPGYDDVGVVCAPGGGGGRARLRPVPGRGRGPQVPRGQLLQAAHQRRGGAIRARGEICWSVTTQPVAHTVIKCFVKICQIFSAPGPQFSPLHTVHDFEMKTKYNGKIKKMYLFFV